MGHFQLMRTGFAACRDPECARFVQADLIIIGLFLCRCYLAQDQQQQGWRRVCLVAEQGRPAGVWIKGALVVMWAEVHLAYVGRHKADLVSRREQTTAFGLHVGIVAKV